MPKVFILSPVANASIDVSKAAAFGDITYVFEHNDKRPSVFNHTAYGRAVIERMTTLGFDNQVDYFCCVGSMVSLAVTLVVLSYNNPTLRILLFDATHGEYVIKQFDSSVFASEQWTR